MSKCIEPGEPGFVFGLFLGYAIGVGVNMARDVGLGLPLVNELLDRWPDLERGQAGQIASIVGQGVSEAVRFSRDQGGATLEHTLLPVLPASEFDSASPEERILIRGQATGVTPDGEIFTRQATFFANEGVTQKEVVDQLTDLLKRLATETDPKVAEAMEAAIVSLFFAGRRF
jgi:hypothetical protein